MRATLYIGNRAGGRMMFYDLEITTSPANGFCNVARNDVDLQKKRSSPLQSPHRCPSSGIVDQNF